MGCLKLAHNQKNETVLRCIWNREKQSKTHVNLYDYGARFYDPQIGRWMTQDPMIEAHQNYTPYAYVYNNPISFIDPFGLDSTYYSDKGKQLNQITGDGGQSNVKFATAGSTTTKLPSDAALGESLNVLDRTDSNGGLREESSLVMNDGSVAKGKTGDLPTISDGVQTAKADLPAIPGGKTSADVETTIHSHPTEIQIQDGKAYPQSATNPSDQDKTTFKNYGTNIIVGRLGQSTVTKNIDGTYNKSYTSKGAVIYNSKGQPQIQLTEKAIRRILK